MSVSTTLIPEPETIIPSPSSTARTLVDNGSRTPPPPPSSQCSQSSRALSPRGSPPPLKARLITEPRSGRTQSFVQYIRNAHRADYEAAKTLIRELVRSKLDVKLVWTEQKTTVRREWPVLYYAYQTFCRLRTEARGAGIISRKRVRGPNASLTATNENISGCCTNASNRRRSSHLPTTTTSTPGPLPDIASALSSDLTNRSSAATTPSSFNHCVDPASQAIAMPAGRKEIEAFLQSLPLQLGALTDRFVSAGLNARERLRVMSRWNVADQEMFLRREVALDAFVSKLVCDALRDGFLLAIPM
ncbi:hypothetical protein C8T65DRAFT_171600 [Cerioporus squamosus]|nr:hypothetical protein C8T65DRAFT_171600 [Cerioporus squamosus]